MLENIIVGVIILLAVVWFVFRFMKKPSCSCNNVTCTKQQGASEVPPCCQNTAEKLNNLNINIDDIDDIDNNEIGINKVQKLKDF